MNYPARKFALLLGFIFIFSVCLISESYACAISMILVSPGVGVLVFFMLVSLIILSAANFRQGVGFAGFLIGYMVIVIGWHLTRYALWTQFQVPEYVLFIVLLVYTLAFIRMNQAWKQTVGIMILVFLVAWENTCWSTYTRGTVVIILVFGISIIHGYKACVRFADKNNLTAVLILIPVVLSINTYLMSRTVIIGCGTSCHSNLKNIGTVMEMYFSDNNSYPQALEQLAPEYIPEVPDCNPSPRCVFFPITYEEIDRYKTVPYRYEVNSELNRYTITCVGENHDWTSAGKGFPRYTSEFGLDSSEYFLKNRMPQNTPAPPLNPPTFSSIKAYAEAKYERNR